jgi:threonine dehydratase
LMMRCTHHLVEPAGAAALAGLIADQRITGSVAGRRIGVIVTGGNIDAPILAEILAGRTPLP